MRKFLLAATILAPFVVAPAFAGSGPNGASMAGDLNLAKTSANSTAGVASTQRTGANTLAAGNGSVIVGAVSGNYTQVQTTASAAARPQGSQTNTTAQQTNVGGTVAGSLVTNKGWGKGVTGSAGGSQNSQATGDANAAAANMNVGGFVKMDQPRHGGAPR